MIMINFPIKPISRRRLFQPHGRPSPASLLLIAGIQTPNPPKHGVRERLREPRRDLPEEGRVPRKEELQRQPRVLRAPRAPPLRAAPRRGDRGSIIRSVN